MGRKILIGCGALSVLGVVGIVFIVVVAAVMSGGETATGSQSGGSGGAAEQQAGSAEENAVPMGRPVRVGDVKWTVTNAQQATELKSAFMGKKQGNFVIVDFNFTNGGTEAVTLDSASLALLDSKGRTFEADTDSFEYIAPSKDIFLEQVNPGVSQPGQVIFTVAPNASNFTLRAGDTDMFSDENGYVDLGF